LGRLGVVSGGGIGIQSRFRLEIPGSHEGRNNLELGVPGAALGGDALAGAGDGETLIIEQLADAASHLDITAAICALPGTILSGLEHGELRLPIPQDVRLYTDQFADLTDLEEQLVRNVNG
jgi:hypothetical protein